MLTAELQTVRVENKELKQQSDEVRENDAHLNEENRELNDRLNELAQELASLHAQQTSGTSLSPSVHLRNSDLSPPFPEDSSTLKTIHHTPMEEVSRTSALISTLTSICQIPIQTFNPLQSSNTTKDNREEIQELQTKLNALTEQYAQLDEANRSWQEFHQQQLGLFRQTMKDWISFDETSTLEKMAQQIVAQLSLDSSVSYESLGKQLSTYQQNESMLAENLEQLNKRLLDVHKQCEEFREHNAQLILSKEQVEKQLREVQETESKQSFDQQIQTESFSQLSSMVHHRLLLCSTDHANTIFLSSPMKTSLPSTPMKFTATSLNSPISPLSI